ncbi:MAG TPA: DoxX family protein [Candidatus Limnocylindria bacterium]
MFESGMVDFGLFIVRVSVGLVFAAHGAQKLFGWWGGPGMDRWTGLMEGMGVRPPRLWATVSALNELAGGLLLAIGLLTPLAAAVLVAQSAVIIARMHWAKGFWNTNGGYEYPLVLGAVALGVAFSGPGAWSLDELMPLGLLYQPIVIWVAVAVALAVGLVAIMMRPSSPPQPPA